MVFKLNIPHTPPSANKLLRMHWRPRHVLLGVWKHDVYWLCRDARVPKCSHISVEATIFFKDKRRRDADNFEFGLRKLLGDALVGVVIEDDCPEYLTWGAVTFDVDPKNPRTEVTLSSV